MKCPDCNREYNGKECPYCHDEYQEVKDESVSKKILFVSIIGLVLCLVSLSVPLFMILVIGALLISFYLLKSEKNKKKIIFINALTIIMLLISFSSFIKPFEESHFGYRDLEDYLKIELPHKKCDDYLYESQHETKYTYYMYELSFDEYTKIKDDGVFNEYNNFDWFIKRVSSLENDYILFNRLSGNNEFPVRGENSLYVFLQLEEISGKYYAHIYSVTIFKSGE